MFTAVLEQRPLRPEPLRAQVTGVRDALVFVHVFSVIALCRKAFLALFTPETVHSSVILVMLAQAPFASKLPVTLGTIPLSGHSVVHVEYVLSSCP